MAELGARTLPRGSLSYASLRLALGLVPLVTQPVGQDLENWLVWMLEPADLIGDQPLGIEIGLAADFSRLSCRLAGAANSFRERMQRFLEGYEVSEQQRGRFEGILAEFRPARIGSWIELGPESIEAGWYLPGEVPLQRALAQADPSPDRDRFGGWAEEQGLQVCERLGRSLADEWSYADLLVVLPHPEREEALQAGLDLFGRLSLPGPPETALAALMGLSQGDLLVDIWLNEEGTAKLGLLAAEPSTELVLRLCRSVGIDQDEALATFEGFLGVEGPAYVEYQLLAEGWGVELGYGPAQGRLVGFDR